MAISRFIASGDLIPFSEYEDWLKAEGYEAGAPSPAGVGEEIDGGACRKATCADCGHAGMRYEPYTKFEDRAEWTGVLKTSYRAFAVCPECGYWEEF